jgi:hypothetical protein
MYVRGMGDTTFGLTAAGDPILTQNGVNQIPGTACDSGYALSSDGTVCESTQTYSLGSPCMASSFPWIGTIDKNVNCVPLSSTPVLIGVGLLALFVFGRGGR